MTIRKRYKLETYKEEMKCECGFLLRVAGYIPSPPDADGNQRLGKWIHRCRNCGKEEIFDKEYPRTETILVEVE